MASSVDAMVTRAIFRSFLRTEPKELMSVQCTRLKADSDDDNNHYHRRHHYH